MVLRSNNNANTNGGVVYANANNDASNVNDNYGSRMSLNGYNARVSATNILGYVLCRKRQGLSQAKEASPNGLKH